MATYATTLRRGLPRASGGEAWPGAGDVPVDAAAVVDAEATVADVANPVVSTSVAERPAEAPSAPAAEAAAEAPPADEVAADAPPAPAATAAQRNDRASRLRRGLPRAAGGEPWPPASTVVPAPRDSAEPIEEPSGGAIAAGAPTAGAHGAATAATVVPATPADASPSADFSAATPNATAPAPAVSATGTSVRRGLPRVAGGEPWPPAAIAPLVPAAGVAGSVPSQSSDPASAAAAAAAAAGETVDTTTSASSAAESREPNAIADAKDAAAPTSLTATVAGPPRRTGLPRTRAGAPASSAAASPAAASSTAPAVPAAVSPATKISAAAAAATPAVTDAPAALPAASESPAPVPTTVPAAALVAAPSEPRAPLPFRPTVFPGAGAFDRPAPAAEPKRYGPFTAVQWTGAVIVGGLGLLFAAALLVLAVRWFVSLDGVRAFLAAFPGQYPLPDSAPVGFPAWVGWQHFFNTFLIVLIIRSGLRVRSEKRPSAFWTPKNNPKGKISLTLWFHQGLDVLWIVNGVIFIVLLFVSGQWMRVIPTSWDVFPNAISAMLQYLSLDWPTEDGWVNYNSLQQLAYFSVTFLAAPLAIITGVRMSGVWPKNATQLNRAYPVEWARAVHYPVMLFFVLFIIVHVALVFATGALRNLNHMYGGQNAVNWTGFWIFVASMVVVAAGWVAARPLVIAPIARLFGKVSAR